MNRINFTLIIFLLLFSNIINSQKNGKIIYEIKTIDFVPKEKNNEIEITIEKAMNQKFSLFFNKNKFSSFKINEIITPEDNSLDKLYNKMALTRFTCNYSYYIDFNQKKEYYLYNDGVLISNNYKEKDWSITKEMKTIDGYLCYKAIYKYEYIARDSQTKTKTITAWFAPSLPFPYGPKNYNGLPGLILELQDWNTTFLATKIELLDDELIIDFPKGKSITQEEYEKKVLSGY